MCGIVAYKGDKDASKVIRDGLKTLEYRGYDSWGIATTDDSVIDVIKNIGKVSETYDSNLKISNNGSNKGIGHTRWATHGGVTKENAHPHLSQNGKIAVVHNGIIENFQEQRTFLKKQNFSFLSDTDTETIPNTIEYHMGRGYDFVEAAKRSFEHMDGQYAVVALNHDGKIVAIRREAPLVLGIGLNNEIFIASDVTAFLEHTKNVIFLEENDMVIVDGSFEIFNLYENCVVERPISRIDWDNEAAKKGDFDHFFMKEILEQADVINRIANIEQSIITDTVFDIKAAKGVYIVACGTAAYACMSGLYLFSKLAKMHINFCVASEFEHFKHFLTEDSLIIAISQSGETADTLSAIRAAKSKGSKVISITNMVGSSIMRESDKSILQKAGPEICVLSTKSYTSQLAIIALIVYEMDGHFDEGIASLRELSRYIYYLTSKNSRDFIKSLSEKLKDVEHIYLLGRNLQYPTALEAALKIKEVSYIHAEAYAGGELKHGNIALISEGTPCIIFTSDQTEKAILSNAMEVKARGAFVIGLGPKDNEIFDFFIKVRDAGDLNPIVQIIPMQILAYQLALLRNCDPDKPRNLAKSVTVK
ncbi:MAG: glutamine--fructose-6-phosphate transaminase (isomerizing) [DPANN group archaeon]|nr:glutamine--fructose-6-phosphate transaminase (isomerizing) [DPANN group archaeon]